MVSWAKDISYIDAEVNKLVALENQAIDERDFRDALASFGPMWCQLPTAEKARVLCLLVETVIYSASADEVEIIFRPGGVRTLAKEGKLKSA